MGKVTHWLHKEAHAMHATPSHDHVIVAVPQGFGGGVKTETLA